MLLPLTDCGVPCANSPSQAEAPEGGDPEEGGLTCYGPWGNLAISIRTAATHPGSFPWAGGRRAWSSWRPGTGISPPLWSRRNSFPNTQRPLMQEVSIRGL